MKQYTTSFSPNASLAMIGQWTQDKGIWKKMEASVHIPQIVIKHTPHEKLKDLLINIWAGGEGIDDVKNRVRTDEASRNYLVVKPVPNSPRFAQR